MPRQVLFTFRSIVLFSSSIAASPCVCGDICASRGRARGTGRDVGLRCRRSWCRAAAMQASRNCRACWDTDRIVWAADVQRCCGVEVGRTLARRQYCKLITMPTISNGATATTATEKGSGSGVIISSTISGDHPKRRQYHHEIKLTRVKPIQNG